MDEKNKNHKLDDLGVTCKYCRWKSKHWRNYTIAGSQHHNHDLDATAARSLTLCQISDEVCSFVRPFGGLAVIELSTAIVAFQSIPTFILEESGCMISSLVDSTTLPSFTRARISSIRRHNGNFLRIEEQLSSRSSNFYGKWFFREGENRGEVQRFHTCCSVVSMKYLLFNDSTFHSVLARWDFKSKYTCISKFIAV